MRQRVAFLRTLMAGRPVLLLDEPFASLDAITGRRCSRGSPRAASRTTHTVLLVTHDVEEALYLSDRVLVMSPRPARVVDRIEIEAAGERPRGRRHLAGLRDPRERALRSLAEARDEHARWLARTRWP